MTPELELNIRRFVDIARAGGWDYLGVQTGIPPCVDSLVLTKKNQTLNILIDPEDFNPLKLATLYLTPEKKMTNTPKLNLRQKLVEIYKELDHVDKAGENTKQHYKFVRAADVMRPIRDAFAKYGIYAETNFEYLGSYDIKTNSGGNMHTAIVKATAKLYDTESDETKTISGLGDGADSGDKGIFKAQTGALKNALRNGTLLPDEGDPNGGDPEADQNVDEQTIPLRDYTDYRGTSALRGETDIPDFREAQHAAPRPAAETFNPKASYSEATATMLAPPPPPVPVELQNQGPAAAPEKGDAYEGPDDDGTLPTEEQLVTYRTKFKTLGDELTVKGKLTAGRGLPVNRKLHVFLLGITKASEAKNITKVQWDNFFERVDTATANPEVGMIGLAKLVNKANGIEKKK